MVSLLSEYIDKIKKFQNIGTGTLWYRGVAQFRFKNIPKIYREDTWKSYGPIGYDNKVELELFKEFKRKSKIKKASDYEYLHLMQHLGLPTRLLDFTESPLTALFFALHDYKNKEKCKCQIDKKNDNSDDKKNHPVVWIINPFQFNHVIHQKDTIYFFFDEAADIIKKYLPPKKNDSPNFPKYPIAVAPAFEDERIIAQKSNFILFGSGMDSIETLYSFKKREFFLEKILINLLFVEQLYAELLSMGVDYFTIFPDMDGLVKELNRKLEFGEIRKYPFSDLL